MKHLKCNIAALVCAFVALLSQSCKEKAATGAAGNYKTITANPSACVLEKEYTATLRGVQSVEVRPQVSGTITKICVSEGAHVKRGQTMFIIDQEPYRASLCAAEADVSSARAAVASAQLELEGKRQLRRSGVVADYDVSQAQCTLDEQLATLRNAEAKLATARTDLSYTEVKSLADGVIGMINYRLGALVSSSIDEPLTTVADVSSVHAYFSVTESEAQRLVADHGSLDKAIATLPCVKLRLGSGEELSAEGTVDAVSGNVAEATGSVAMRTTFANPSRILFSGGSATIVIPYKYTNRIIIPQEATYEIQDKKFVYRVVDGKTKSTEITVEPLSDGKRYVVTDGLKKGDGIVAEGAGLLSDGMEIKVKK